MPLSLSVTVFIPLLYRCLPMSDSSRPDLTSSSSRSKNLPTGKFYVRSGMQRLTVLAISPEVAAERFIHNALKTSLISGVKPLNKDLRLLDPKEAMLLTKELDSKILVSEAGFSRSEAGEFSTSSVVARWRLQIAALEQMMRPTN